jgi:hypothetical protein
MKSGAWLLLASIVLVGEAFTAFSEMSLKTAITADLSVGWLFQGNDIILQIEKSRAGFAAFGLGTSMSSGDVVVIETTGSAITVRDCRLNGQTTPDCAENQDWTVVDKTVTSSSFKVEIKRAATATETNDRSYVKGKNNVIYAYTDSPTLTYHSGTGAGYGVKVLDLATGSVTIDDSPRMGDGTWMPHEHTQLFLWTIIADLLIPVGRHLRRYNRFFDGHSWPLLIVLILSIIFRKGDGEVKRDMLKAHGALSIVLIVLSGLITFNGLFLRFLIEFDKKPFKVQDITLIRRVHSILGVLCWAIARATVFTGAVMHKDRFGPLVLNLVIAETCLFVAIMLVLDFFRYRQFAAKPNNMLEENGKSQLMANNVQIIQDLRSQFHN